MAETQICVQNAVPRLPSDLVNLIVQYSWICDVCEQVRRLLLAKDHWTIYVSQAYSYTDEMEISISDGRANLMYNSETGTCDLCSSTYSEECYVPVDQLVCYIAHRWSISELMNKKSVDLFAMASHITPSRVPMYMIDGQDHVGLKLRHMLLGEDEDCSDYEVEDYDFSEYPTPKYI